MQEEEKKQEMIEQTEAWQKELASTLNKEKNSDDEFSQEGGQIVQNIANQFEFEQNDDDEYFDDKFLNNNHNYIKMQQIYGKKQDEEDSDTIKTDDIFVSFESRQPEFNVCMDKVRENHKKKLLEKSKLE